MCHLPGQFHDGEETFCTCICGSPVPWPWSRMIHLGGSSPSPDSVPRPVAPCVCVCVRVVQDNPEMHTLCACGENRCRFHYPCLLAYIERSGSRCPACRAPLYFEEYS
jgi:hypothetical protein